MLFRFELDLTDLEQRVKSWNATSLIGDLFLKYVCIVLFNYRFSVSFLTSLCNSRLFDLW
jgi:hypothetical protein